MGDTAAGVIYNKGGFIVHMLRMMMWDPKTGDERFFAMMKDFVKTHFNQNVSTADFMTDRREAHDSRNGPGRQQEDGLVLPAMGRGELPSGVSARLSTRASEKGQTRLILKVTQANVDEHFIMPVPIYLQFKKGISGWAWCE